MLTLIGNGNIPTREPPIFFSSMNTWFTHAFYHCPSLCFTCCYYIAIFIVLVSHLGLKIKWSFVTEAQMDDPAPTSISPEDGPSQKAVVSSPLKVFSWLICVSLHGNCSVLRAMFGDVLSACVFACTLPFLGLRNVTLTRCLHFLSSMIEGYTEATVFIIFCNFYSATVQPELSRGALRLIDRPWVPTSYPEIPHLTNTKLDSAPCLIYCQSVALYTYTLIFRHNCQET